MNDNDQTREGMSRLQFIVEQLCSDLGELVAGLSSGVVPYSTALEGATLQLDWARNELHRMSKDGPP